MKIGFKETDSKEYRCVTMAMYSFVIFMLFFALCRLCGWFWFSVEYKPIEVAEWLFWLIMGIYKTIEGFVILKILTIIKSKYCIIISALYTILNFSIINTAIQFFLDVLYIVSIPFVFNNNKEKSILHSFFFIIIISIYQIFMLFGRYNMEYNGKYDLFYQVFSTLDYKIFLILIMLYSIKRRLKYA